MHPLPELASTKYCLANPGSEYIVYLPQGGEAMVDLSSVRGDLKVAWVHPVEGTTVVGGKVSGGAKRKLKSPFGNHAVLWLSKV
ncbi:MAG: putative collagen-binding domain-containing protein [Candidatus Fervidibacter sp.]|uniref:putative collagen-binding domain-containing protein n=1 Tax=Candidatus Fervidibacter sp. TaxID=3100871 RepID=UPI00404A7370